jgi:hypothetical protein
MLLSSASSATISYRIECNELRLQLPITSLDTAGQRTGGAKLRGEVGKGLSLLTLELVDEVSRPSLTLEQNTDRPSRFGHAAAVAPGVRRQGSAQKTATRRVGTGGI